MSVELKLDYKDFENACKAAISKSGLASYTVVKSIAEQIYNDTLEEVPEDTKTLRESAFYDVQRNSTSTEAIIGYAGSNINPKTGRPVSEYVVAVHEDLDATHIKGKAKFLEDPINRHASNLDTTFASNLWSAINNLFKG